MDKSTAARIVGAKESEVEKVSGTGKVTITLVDGSAYVHDEATGTLEWAKSSKTTVAGLPGHRADAPAKADKASAPAVAAVDVDALKEQIIDALREEFSEGLAAAIADLKAELVAVVANAETPGEAPAPSADAEPGA